MVISAAVTILPRRVAKERIREIIDNDPRIKAEIQARIDQMNLTNSTALDRINAAKHLTRQERDSTMERKKRELAIYKQYDQDSDFKQKVNDRLRG